MEYLVVADVDGTLYGVWSDDLIELYEVEKGKVEVQRASHVEPCTFSNFLVCVPGVHWHVWEVDHKHLMTAIAFKTRASALAWEKQEIERRLQEETIKWTS